MLVGAGQEMPGHARAVAVCDHRVLQVSSLGERLPLFPGFLFFLCSLTLPGPSAPEVATLWHCTNQFIIIIIIINLCMYAVIQSGAAGVMT